jgi:heme/copper-type cytochrome/quinol oxidase subunit 4
MIVDTWWMNVITLVLTIVLFICTLILYLHMNNNQQKESRNVALIITGSVMFGLILVILAADVFVELTRDRRTEATKIREERREKLRGKEKITG